jgi:Cupin-like domain
MSLLSSNFGQRFHLPEQILDSDRKDFCDNFNQKSFEFSHNLAEHPLFEIPRLVELANTIASKHDRNKVVCLSSNIQPDRKWSDMAPKEQITETIANIEKSGSLVVIKSAHLDPDYKILMDRILAELEDLTGVPLQKEITWSETYVFISSPNSITPYHIDHESNFLFQIKGEKDVHLFDPFDRSILTEREIEEYFAYDLQAATYREENQNKANIYHLIPGKAVHHPSLAPHWVKNSNNVSVSLSINFCMRSIDLNARVYQVNHFLRKLGINPTPPGHSVIKDRAKMTAMGMFAKSKPDIKNDVVFSGVLRFKELFKYVSKNLGK